MRIVDVIVVGQVLLLLCIIIVRMQIVGVIVSHMSPPSCRLFSLAQGIDACFKTNNVNIGTNSCHGNYSCKDVSDSTIGNDSCQSWHGSCGSVQNSVIHDGSCQGDYSCYGVKYATIGKGSCNAGSDRNYSSCDDLVDNVKIGNNSCNGHKVCYECKHNVPDNACNQWITDDIDIYGYCNYCL